MTRVVISIENDISPLFPMMSKAIDSCGITRKPPRAVFRHREWGVVVHPHEITIMNTDDPAAAEEVMDVLRMVENMAEKNKKKTDAQQHDEER